jgi:hypothetical protein
MSRAVTTNASLPSAIVTTSSQGHSCLGARTRSLRRTRSLISTAGGLLTQASLVACRRLPSPTGERFALPRPAPGTAVDRRPPPGATGPRARTDGAPRWSARPLRLSRPPPRRWRSGLPPAGRSPDGGRWAPQTAGPPEGCRPACCLSRPAPGGCRRPPAAGCGQGPRPAPGRPGAGAGCRPGRQRRRQQVQFRSVALGADPAGARVRRRTVGGRVDVPAAGEHQPIQSANRGGDPGDRRQQHRHPARGHYLLGVVQREQRCRGMPGPPPGRIGVAAEPDDRLHSGVT